MKVVITSSDYNDPQYAIYVLIISTLCYFLNIHLLAVVNIGIEVIYYTIIMSVA